MICKKYSMAIPLICFVLCLWPVIGNAENGTCEEMRATYFEQVDSAEGIAKNLNVFFEKGTNCNRNVQSIQRILSSVWNEDLAFWAKAMEVALKRQIWYSTQIQNGFEKRLSLYKSVNNLTEQYKESGCGKLARFHDSELKSGAANIDTVKQKIVSLQENVDYLPTWAKERQRSREE